MRVVRAERFGPPAVLVPGTAPDPTPGAGEVLVDVTVAPVLFLDAQLRRGWGRDSFPVRPPYVPGMGVAGHVSAVGDGVDGSWVGRAVLADTMLGGYASAAAVPASGLVPVPKAVPLADAAALLHDGRTALRLVSVHPPAGRVLVTGAGGALGLLLVQLAHAAGAEVVAAARDPRKRELAESLGARTVDYADPSWPSSVGAVDVGYDGVGGAVGRAALDLVVPGGRFSAHGGASGDFTPVDARPDVTVTGIGEVQLRGAEATRYVELALAESAASRLRPVIGGTYPLDHAAGAHEAMENRTAAGKTLLTV
jgi:NADPH:quinone reductase